MYTITWTSETIPASYINDRGFWVMYDKNYIVTRYVATLTEGTPAEAAKWIESGNIVGASSFVAGDVDDREMWPNIQHAYRMLDDQDPESYRKVEARVMARSGISYTRVTVVNRPTTTN